MTRCLVCPTEFPTPKGQNAAKRFCGPVCRGRFHEACRKYAERMVDEGKLTIAELFHIPDHGSQAVDGSLDAESQVQHPELPKE